MPCFWSDALELARDLAVGAGHDAIEELDHRHLAAEPGPDRAELEPDDAGADHQQTLRGTLKLQRPGRGDDLLLVDLDAREIAETEPEAMTMALVAMVCGSPFSGVTRTLAGGAIEPCRGRW